MIRPLSHIQRAMRDPLGSWDAVDARWRAMRDAGAIIEHRTGPETALYELDDRDAFVMWLEAVDKQGGVVKMCVDML